VKENDDKSSILTGLDLSDIKFKPSVEDEN